MRKTFYVSVGKRLDRQSYLEHLTTSLATWLANKKGFRTPIARDFLVLGAQLSKAGQLARKGETIDQPAVFYMPYGNIMSRRALGVMAESKRPKSLPRRQPRYIPQEQMGD